MASCCSHHHHASDHRPLRKAGKLQEEKADRLRDAAEAEEKVLEEAIRNAFLQVKDGVVLAELTRSLNDGDEEAALEASKIETLQDELSGPLTVGMLAALLAGARLGREELPASMRAVAPAVDVLEDSIQEWIRTNGARQVTQISDGSRRAIQQVISEMITSGETARRAARQIREFIGLTVPQQETLVRLRNSMREAGATKAVIERTVAARAAKMLDERAFTIARNESFIAVAQGQELYWGQLVDQGALDPGTKRKWITADDERVCPICRPMHNQIRGLNEPFEKGLGGTTMTTPAHVICRCSVILINPRPPEE